MIASNQLLKAHGKMLGYADELSKMHGVTLDYSISSLRVVDKLLHSIYLADVKKNKLTSDLESGLYGVALAMGCYIIEVIERNYGAGTWRRKVDDLGHEQLPYAYEGVEIMPVGWCLYSLYNGVKHNVQDQFRAFTRKLEDDRE